jgi:hypothetical protein
MNVFILVGTLKQSGAGGRQVTISRWSKQGTLMEGDGSVQLTSSPRYLVL